MKSIEFKTGNFVITLKEGGQVMSSKQDEILGEGLVSRLQREVASKCYLELKGVPTANGKGKKLPPGFKRDDLAYSEQSAEEFRRVASEVLAKVGVFEIEVGPDLTVDPASLKAAEGFIARGKALEVAIKIAEACGYEVDDATSAQQLAVGLVRYNKFLEEEVKRKAAESFAGL